MRVAFLCVLLAACHAHPSAPAPIRMVDAPVADVLQALATRAHTGVVVDPLATRLANCAHVTLVAAADVSPSQLAELVGVAIRTAGLSMTGTPAGWTVTRSLSGVTPRGCESVSDDRMTPRAPPPPVAPAPSAAASVPTESLDGITRDGPYAITLTRAAAIRLASPVEFFRGARVLPVNADGGLHGLRVAIVRPASVAGALGFQNGDTIVSMDGVPLDSDSRMIDAFARIGRESSFEFGIQRLGAEATLHYRVVP